VKRFELVNCNGNLNTQEKDSGGKRKVKRRAVPRKRKITAKKKIREKKSKHIKTDREREKYQNRTWSDKETGRHKKEKKKGIT